MGCCASSDGAVSSQGAKTSTTQPAASKNSVAMESPSSTGAPDGSAPLANQPTTSPLQPAGAETSSGGGDDGKVLYIPEGVKGAKAFLPATADPNHTDASTPAPVPTSQSSGPKAVRGWAPPTKEWDKDTGTKKSDQTRIEVKEEWDEDGNLVRTTIKKTITPDWKWKTEKTVDIIPASEEKK